MKTNRSECKAAGCKIWRWISNALEQVLRKIPNTMPGSSLTSEYTLSSSLTQNTQHPFKINDSIICGWKHVCMCEPACTVRRSIPPLSSSCSSSRRARQRQATGHGVGIFSTCRHNKPTECNTIWCRAKACKSQTKAWSVNSPLLMFTWDWQVRKQCSAPPCLPQFSVGLKESIRAAEPSASECSRSEQTHRQTDYRTQEGGLTSVQLSANIHIALHKKCSTQQVIYSRQYTRII